MRQWDQKVHKIPVSRIVYFISQNNRYEPDAGTSHWRATVIVSLFTVQNDLGMSKRNKLSCRESNMCAASDQTCRIRVLLQPSNGSRFRRNMKDYNRFVITFLLSWETCLTAHFDKKGTVWHAYTNVHICSLSFSFCLHPAFHIHTYTAPHRQTHKSWWRMNNQRVWVPAPV